MAQQGSRGFLSHLAELRTRLVRVALVWIVLAALSLAVTPDILRILIAPYGSLLKVIGPTESVSAYVRIAMTCSGAAALPYALLEVWGFVSPGLLPKERRLAGLMIPAGFLLFMAGAAFTWFVLVPAAIRFLAGFGPGIFETEWTSQNYIPFVTSLLFWIGLSFELPLLAFVLAKMRIIDARMLLKAWRFAIVAIVVLAAVITPTVDPFNLMLVACPLVVLYFFSILLALLARRRRSGEAGPAGGI